MAHNHVGRLRAEMANKGIEITPDTLNEVLQAAAYIASLVGGVVYLETSDGWGLEVGLDPEDDSGAWVDAFVLKDDFDEEMN